jgi:hypothetical protein
MTVASPETIDAETPRPGSPRRRSTQAGFTGIAVFATLSVAAAVAWARPGPDPLPACGPCPAVVSPAPVLSPGSGAAGPLIAVADLIAPVPADNTVGRYTYVEVNHWSRRDQTDIVPFAERRWRADDGSGRVVTRELPAIPARTFTVDQIPGTDFGKATPRVEDFAPGGITWGIAGPVPTLPRDMSALLRGGQPGGAPPEVQLDFYAGLFGWDYLGRDSRAAALRALAVVPGLVYEGETTDRAGRLGIAVSLTTAGVRLLLIVDRHSAELLATERSVPGFVVDDYTLFLHRDHTANLDTT